MNRKWDVGCALCVHNIWRMHQAFCGGGVPPMALLDFASLEPISHQPT
jgi:hypothetical protein